MASGGRGIKQSRSLHNCKQAPKRRRKINIKTSRSEPFPCGKGKHETKTQHLTPEGSLELTLCPRLPGPGNMTGESDSKADTQERISPHRERGEMATHLMFPPPELKGKQQQFVIILCLNPQLHRNVLIGGNCINMTVKCRKFNTYWSEDAEAKGLTVAPTHSHCRHTHSAPASLRP